MNEQELRKMRNRVFSVLMIELSGDESNDDDQEYFSRLTDAVMAAITSPTEEGKE